LEFYHRREEQLRHQVVVPAYCRIHRAMLFLILLYDQIFYSHFFQMLHLRHHVVVDDHHLDVVDHQLVLHLLELIYMENLVHQLMIHRYVEENLHQLVDAILLDVQQNLVEQNLDVNPPYLDVAVHRQVVVVDVEARHQLKMDYYLDVVQPLEVQIFLLNLLQRHEFSLPPPLLPLLALVVLSMH
jgi:hypothetical protein